MVLRNQTTLFPVLLVSFQEKFKLIDAWMLAGRSKEEVWQLKEEMRRFESGLEAAKEKLEEVFDKDHKSDDFLVRGKAFIIQSEIRRLDRLLDDCNVCFRGAVSAYSKRDILRTNTYEDGESDATDGESTDGEITDGDGETSCEDEVLDCEGDSDYGKENDETMPDNAMALD